MSSLDWLSASSSDPMGLTAAVQTVQADRTQLAQFAIMRATSALSAGNNDQAITAFKQALAFDSNNTTAYNYLGQLYLNKGNTDDAIKAYQQLVRIQSNQSTADTSSNAPTLEAATIGLGNAYLQAKKYVQSEQQYKTAEKLNPKDPLPPYTLGQQYLTQGRLSEALTQIQQAQKLSPNDGNVYYALGSIYNAQGNYGDAASALQTSLQLKPKFPSANYQLGIAYNGLNYNDGVQQQLSILNSSDTNLASQLSTALKPQITGIDASNRQNTFNTGLGPGTPLYYLDPVSLISPNSSRTVSAVIQFSTNMDLESVTNAANWTLSRGNNAQSGYYNNSMPASSKDASIPATPISVTYNSTNNEATVKFQLSQNSSGNAIIDPKHLVFTFNGQDAAGQSMDQTANSIDGNATAGFGAVNYFA
jgi:tetratricopeptide (TPR) repeat protein